MAVICGAPVQLVPAVEFILLLTGQVIEHMSQLIDYRICPIVVLFRAQGSPLWGGNACMDTYVTSGKRRRVQSRSELVCVDEFNRTL